VNRYSALIVGVVTTLGALVAAVGYLATNAWFGAGDLQAMAFWSVPLGLLVAGVTHIVRRSLLRGRALWAYLVLVPLGAVLGIAWMMVAAMLLGGWIGAFSFPVLFCWITGGTLGGIVAAWSDRLRSWPVAVVLTGLVGVALLRANAYAQAPEPRVRVVVKPNATPEEVQRVWTHVLGRPTGRGDEHDLLPGLSGVSASGSEGPSDVLTVSFWKSTSARDRDSLVAQIRRSPLVVRVDPVAPSDTSGVRTSVSY
jgi:hypothetical protein